MYVSEMQQGRPRKESDSPLSRPDKEWRTYDLLDELEIPYERIDHDKAMTIDACEVIDERLGATICKNLFLCNSKKDRYYLLMLPGDKRFQTKVISKQIGESRLSFAKEDAMERLLDITPGSVSIMGLMNDKAKEVTLLLDRDLLETEHIGCHPCINTASLRLKTKDILERFLPHTGHEPIVVDC